jgi:periplasmic protein TonB
MRDPLLTKGLPLSPRIADLVFQAEPAGRWRRWALGSALVAALYGGAFALVSRLGSSLGPWSAEMSARIHEAIAMERSVEVTLPPPPAPLPPVPVEEAPHVAVSRAPRAPHTQAARAPSPAQAGQLAADSPEPADFTGTAFIVGSGTSYAGGTTFSSATSRKAALGSGAPEAPKAASASARSQARLVSLDQSAWNCPWPAEADAEQVNEQTVVVRATVGADGRPEHVDVLSDPGLGFGRAARLCAQRTRFEPARNAAGQPIAAQSPPIRVHFYR